MFNKLNYVLVGLYIIVKGWVWICFSCDGDEIFM